ncbi:replication initiator protein A [Streptococcus agalactiae]|uniref:replication initiator protein A n=1 Tax=Streptococcus agalactiae TaxID=1311 RepID=UPI000A352EAC|nr:replication initiator protein A [Streptococcus agalactiae]OTG44331.1 replication initiator protein A [Streptococcus agalactiae]OTG47871.1 replication initiator protein A [Streptococcus agalactiae]OTG50945.1 replication initiator protein A [Streptococcus agalactiae]OTG55593.1 replication initiator protein A [Streptococcus agalactiae]RRA75883.1 replication initiator protein A [Streptococcus agalactiae]
MSIKFNYYYGKEADQFSFFRIPKLLFTDPIFASLSSDAKVLYGILLDRMNLSMKNNWIDEENKVYIIFTIEEIAEIMCCATQKATKILQELDDKKGIGLVEKKRLGLGKPNILYVKNFILQEGKDKKEKTHIQEETINQELLKSQFKNDENHNSGNVNFTNQELCKSQCNKTNINKTEYSDTEYNNTSPISPSKEKIIKDNSLSQKQDTEVEEVIEILKQNIDYSFLVKEQLEDKRKIDLIINVMGEVIQGNTDIRINRRMIAYEIVKEQFLSLQKEHIQYVLFVLDENKKKITNLRAYLLSLLYNAPVNILGMTTEVKSNDTDYSKDMEIWQEIFNTT